MSDKSVAKKGEQVLWVEIIEAAPNRSFSEEVRAAVRFLRFSRPVKCPMCKRKVRLHWTMLCEFTALRTDSIVATKSEPFPPLAAVCGDHPLAPLVSPRANA